MLLRRVTITGFKSFANKTVIELESGITAIVGPNGSGKSNFADAIRWALGEQTKGRLRLSERDEVVFAGSDKRARASYAEVVLLFDNQDGAFPLDLTEVEIGRRLYRSGETDYRLAGRSVRYSDIQSLLAQAGVGAGSYAVIGQGMIDSILMSSPAERKLLFDEAAGIRGPELGREAARRKLTATATNLTRLRDILAELEPQLVSLQGVIGSSQEQAELESAVDQLRTHLASSRFAYGKTEISTAEAEITGLTKTAHDLRHQRRHLQAAQARRIEAQQNAEAQRERLYSGLSTLERHRDQAAALVAKCESRVAGLKDSSHNLDRVTRDAQTAETELTSVQERLNELRAELKTNIDAAARAAKAVERTGREVATAQEVLVALREGSADDARDQYLDHALQILKTLAVGLADKDLSSDQVKLLVHKAGRLLSHATRNGADELLEKLQDAQKRLENAMIKRETAVEHQTNVSITGRSLEIDLAHLESDVIRQTEHRDQSAAALGAAARAQDELAAAETAQAQAAKVFDELGSELKRSRQHIANLVITSGSAQTQTEDILGLERATAGLNRVAQQLDEVRARRLSARAQVAAARHQAADWKIEIDTSALTQSSISLASLAEQLARAETLLEARTQARADDIARYGEVSGRSTQLASQIADLEAAEADFTSLIGRLDGLIRERFKANFEQLATNFSRYFNQLFDGGQASLELTETADGTYGITIQASPAGKRLASIAALSGGERALAGVALVAAILRVNPAPFVVLDEIDAALDEANSGRLASILSELQAYSQLIVITHNRQTMKSAQVLFGVTMNEHHVSHVLSMRLEEATQLAAR